MILFLQIVFQIEQHAVAHRAADVQQLRHDCEIGLEFETNRVESETEIKSWPEPEETRIGGKRSTCSSRPETTTTAATATTGKTNTQSSQTNKSKKSGETSAAACSTAKESAEAATTTTRSTTESFETKTGSESKPNQTET